MTWFFLDDCLELFSTFLKIIFISMKITKVLKGGKCEWNGWSSNCLVWPRYQKFWMKNSIRSWDSETLVMLCIFANYAAQHEGQWRWECKMIAAVPTLDTDNALLLLSLTAWLGGWFCHLTHWRRRWCRCRRWSCPLLASPSESCHDMYIVSAALQLLAAAAATGRVVRYITHPASLYSLYSACTQRAGRHRQCTPTFYSKEQGVVRTNTRHPPPPPHDVIIHHAHHQPAAGEETHDNLGLQSRHDTLWLGRQVWSLHSVWRSEHLEDPG